jgi:hypothetical protein
VKAIRPAAARARTLPLAAFGIGDLPELHSLHGQLERVQIPFKPSPFFFFYIYLISLQIITL